MRHNDGAARPVFLNIGCIAYPNGIRARIIARINTVGLGLGTGINTKPPRRVGWLREGIPGRGCLRGSRELRRCLRFGVRGKQ